MNSDQRSKIDGTLAEKELLRILKKQGFTRMPTFNVALPAELMKKRAEDRRRYRAKLLAQGKVYERTPEQKERRRQQSYAFYLKKREERIAMLAEQGIAYKPKPKYATREEALAVRRERNRANSKKWREIRRESKQREKQLQEGGEGGGAGASIITLREVP